MEKNPFPFLIEEHVNLQIPKTVIMRLISRLRIYPGNRSKPVTFFPCKNHEILRTSSELSKKKEELAHRSSIFCTVIWWLPATKEVSGRLIQHWCLHSLYYFGSAVKQFSIWLDCLIWYTIFIEYGLETMFEVPLNNLFTFSLGTEKISSFLAQHLKQFREEQTLLQSGCFC